MPSKDNGGDYYYVLSTSHAKFVIPFTPIYESCCDLLLLIIISGHDTNTSLDSYLDRSNPIYCLPAAYALHGYKHIRAKKAVFPKINARSLGNVNKESMERLVDAMFEINIPEFLKGGTLRSVVDICAA